MITTEREQLFQEIDLPREHFEPAQTQLERWVRKGLVLGFCVVLLLEGWLLTQALLG